MIVVTLILSTVLLTIWLLLLNRSIKEDLINSAYNKILKNCDLIEKISREEKERLNMLKSYEGITANGIRFILDIRQLILGAAHKRLHKVNSVNKALQNGNFRNANIFVLPGYVLLREFDVLCKLQAYVVILRKNNELYGKKHSLLKTRYLLASILSYTIIGTAATLLTGSIIIGFSSLKFGAPVMGIGLMLMLVLIYAMYDELNSQVNKRRDLIIKQFPNVVSKLALLVTSGMIMDKAWKMTALSRESELYMEMRQTSDEMDNLKSADTAYGSFINRCNTKETTKLAGAIMQNLTKGNAELGRVLKDMAREAWLNRQHKAKRDAANANSKLMIPTMMLFLAILVMLMVPIAMSFSGI